MATEIKEVQALYIIDSPKDIILDSLEEAIRSGGDNVNWHVFVRGVHGLNGNLKNFADDLTTLMALPQIHRGSLESYALNYWWTWLEMLPQALRKYVCLMRGKYEFEEKWLDRLIEALDGDDEAIQGHTVITPLDCAQNPDTKSATKLLHHIEAPPIGVWLTDYAFFIRHGFPGVGELPEEYYGASLSQAGELFGGLNRACVKPWLSD